AIATGILFAFFLVGGVANWLTGQTPSGPHMSYIKHAPRWAEIDPDLEKLFHPASAFDHPQDVVRDPRLTTAEKRAILSFWASDACAAIRLARKNAAFQGHLLPATWTIGTDSSASVSWARWSTGLRP